MKVKTINSKKNTNLVLCKEDIIFEKLILI